MLKILNQLSIMYNLNPNEIIQMNGRQKDLVEARRMYIYYLNKQKGIPHNHMKKYIDGMHHATSIYHCKKLEEQFPIYNDLIIKYIELLYQADPEEFYRLHGNIIFEETMKKIIKIKN